MEQLQTRPSNSITRQMIRSILTIIPCEFISADGTFVIAHPSAAAGILAQAGLTNSLLTFNGDDAIELIRNFSRIDLIGQIGFDHGTAWVGAAGTSTSLKTMIRKSTVTS